MAIFIENLLIPVQILTQTALLLDYVFAILSYYSESRKDAIIPNQTFNKSYPDTNLDVVPLFGAGHDNGSRRTDDTVRLRKAITFLVPIHK